MKVVWKSAELVSLGEYDVDRVVSFGQIFELTSFVLVHGSIDIDNIGSIMLPRLICSNFTDLLLLLRG